MGCLPVSWILGVIGIFLDRRKWLAIVTTAISTGLLILLFAPVLYSIFCR